MSRENVKLTVVAAFCLVVGLGGPSMADGVRHAVFAHQAAKADQATQAWKAKRADKVDGRHAVGASASRTRRAGKLVATNGAGRLPDDIIAEAPDAARLGGQAPATYTTYWLAVRADGTIRSHSVGLEGVSVSKLAGNGRYCIALPKELVVQTDAVMGSIQESVGGSQDYTIAITTSIASNACKVSGRWDVAVRTRINDAGADGSFSITIPGTPASEG